MLTPRLPIAARDIARVAELAQVCRAVVVRYRTGANIRRAQEAAITQAAAEMPGDAQMELVPYTGAELVAAAQAAIEPRTDDEIADIVASIQGEPVASIAAPPPTGPPSGVGPYRCRVTCELPDGTTAPADERPGHWWEPRPEEGTP